MDLTLIRLNEDSKSTLGALYIDKDLVGFTCEDPHREVKIDGETRIPSGRYEVKFREVMSGMTKKYRDKYDWFTYHLELQDVPDFEYVYIHVGNTADHSEGCILLGQSASPTDKGWMVGNSAKTFAPFYLKVSEALKNGEQVFISVVTLGGE